jgi:osmotically-inducible protein OsmY
MAPDEELTKRIDEALVRDHCISGQRIRVSVLDGIATLQGSVQSYRRKLAAEEIAVSFHDCHGVANELTVVPPLPLPDGDVANLVRVALDVHADIVKETITVAVDEGVVTLAGTVRRAWERDVAADVALGVRGVREVRNLLLVDFVEQIDDEELAHAIQSALVHTRGLRNVPIRVAVSGGRVVLSGEVSRLWQKEIATSVAETFQPVQLRNEIVVTGH